MFDAELSVVGLTRGLGWIWLGHRTEWQYRQANSFCTLVHHSYGRQLLFNTCIWGKVFGWVSVGLDTRSTSSVDCVASGQLFGGLGWAWSMKMVPRTTLV